MYWLLFAVENARTEVQRTFAAMLNGLQPMNNVEARASDRGLTVHECSSRFR